MKEPDRGHCKSCGKEMAGGGCYCPACLSAIAKASLAWRKKMFGDKR